MKNKHNHYHLAWREMWFTLQMVVRGSIPKLILIIAPGDNFDYNF